MEAPQLSTHGAKLGFMSPVFHDIGTIEVGNQPFAPHPSPPSPFSLVLLQDDWILQLYRNFTHNTNMAKLSS